MKVELIKVSSITYAHKGRDILRQNGFKCYIQRLPKGLKDVGCGYCINVSGGLIDEAEKLLLKNNIKLHGRIEVEQ